MNLDQVNSYLHYGYLPKQELFRLPFSPALLREPSSLPLAQVVEHGIDVLRRSILQAVEDVSACSVPLSGGLDSRVIAATLAEAGKDVTAVTFGTPGTYDYEIGSRVARVLHLKHELLDLTRIPVRTDDLMNAARDAVNWTGVFDTLYNRRAANALREQGPIVSGFMGGALAGAQLRPRGPRTWASATAAFVGTQRYCRSLVLTRPGFDPAESLPQRPFAQRLDTYEQLDFAVKQTCSVAPILFDPESDYRKPFLDEDWVALMVNAPEQWRIGEQLYRAILVSGWRQAFSLPAKNVSGVPISAAHAVQVIAKNLARARRGSRRAMLSLFPWFPLPPKEETNYIDYSWAIRKHASIRDSVSENVRDLEKRHCMDWLSPSTILKRHLSGQADHSDALVVLTGLEVNLKAEEGGP